DSITSFPLPLRTAIEIVSLCTSSPIYLISLLIVSGLLGGKVFHQRWIFPPSTRCHRSPRCERCGPRKSINHFQAEPAPVHSSPVPAGRSREYRADRSGQGRAGTREQIERWRGGPLCENSLGKEWRRQKWAAFYNALGGSR